MSSPVSSLRNLGPAMEQAFADVDIHSAEELRELGTDAAYARLLSAGSRPHFIAYYVIEMALQGRPWNDCKGKEKDALRLRFDGLVKASKEGPAGDFQDLAIERVLNEIGVGRKR